MDYIEKGLRVINRSQSTDRRGQRIIVDIGERLKYGLANDHFQRNDIEGPYDVQESHIYVHPLFTFNRETGEVVVKGKTVQLKPMQAKILNDLAWHPNRLMTLRALSRNLRSRDEEVIEPDLTTVRVHISKIREKIGKHLNKKDAKSFIKTVKDSGKGTGYMLTDFSRLSEESGNLLRVGVEQDI